MGWKTLAIFLQCMAFQCIVGQDIKHRRGEQVNFTERGICKSWLPSVHIPTQYSLEISVMFDDFCHQLPHFGPVGFIWAFDVKHSPHIPNTGGRLERFFCNCLDKKPCTKIYTDLLLAHNVLYNFTIIPHCFRTLCDSCVRLMFRNSWRNESITVTPKESGIISKEELKTSKIHVFVPVFFGLVLLTIIVFVIGIFFRYKLLTFCKTQCGCATQHSINEMNYNLVPNQHRGTHVETGGYTSMVKQPKKRVLLIHEEKTDNQTLLQFLSAIPMMTKYIKLDNVNEMKHNINNMLDVYNSVILVFEDWMIESRVGDKIDGGYRGKILNILKSFKSGLVASKKRLHVLLIEKNEAQYNSLKLRYKINLSTPYFMSRDEILPPIIHLLVNICSDREETDINQHIYDKSNKDLIPDHEDNCKKILLLAEQNMAEYTTLVSVFQELKNHISVDDINTLINSSKIMLNKYDWVSDVQNNYGTVVVLQQDWMVQKNVECTRNVVKNTIEELTEIILGEHYDRNRKINLYAVLKNGHREVLDKFMLYYSINEEIVFTLSTEMDFNDVLDQMVYLVFRILTGRSTSRLTS